MTRAPTGELWASATDDEIRAVAARLGYPRTLVPLCQINPDGPDTAEVEVREDRARCFWPVRRFRRNAHLEC
jgi:hypothetical protein